MKASEQINELVLLGNRVEEMEQQLEILCDIIFNEYPNNDDRWVYAKKVYDKLKDYDSKL